MYIEGIDCSVFTAKLSFISAACILYNVYYAEGIFVIFRTRDVLLSLSTPLSASAYDIWAYETRQTRTGLQFCLSAQSYPGVKCAAESPSGEFLYDTPGLLSPNIIRLYPVTRRHLRDFTMCVGARCPIPRVASFIAACLEWYKSRLLRCEFITNVRKRIR